MEVFNIFWVVFINQRHDLVFVFKFRKICKKCKSYSEEWLTEINDYRYLMNVNVACFKNLRILNVTHCRNITDDSIKELKNLHTLYISYMNITDAGIKELKNLHTLYANGMSITD